ncbi:MAG TPA: S1/P1 nuclease, partial [Chthoniobacterales bacterium]|nr:S1/P1 nuclease [Chthoniobacterales bacterium]
IAILEGHSNATNNPTGIPPSTALRLLVHYVGDIHQPLHVGAVYFGPNAQPANPNTTTGTKFATGGNAIAFKGTPADLHTYWDTPTVSKAMADAHAQTPGAFAQIIIANPPQGWESGPFMSGWSVKWANEVIPISTVAHNKLSFSVNGQKWSAQTNDFPGYNQWAAAQVRTEIARAGYRLAAILKKIWP